MIRPHRSPQVFPEAGGFVLLDPQRLDELAPEAHGLDLLDLMMTTEVGDAAARSGVAVPVLGVEPGYYDLYVHTVDDVPLAVQRPPDLVAPGWVLETISGRLLLDPLAALQEWDPADPRHTWVSVPPGAYVVEVRGHLPGPGQVGAVDGSYSWVLRPTAALGWFTADLPGGTGSSGP